MLLSLIVGYYVPWTEGALFVSGPLEGLTCDAEAVQSANSAQLHSILSELVDTTFFRLVRVEDDVYCPIEALRAPSGDSSICGAPPDNSFMGSGPSLGNSAWLTMPPADAPVGPSLCNIEVEVSPQEVAEQVITSITTEEVSAQNEFPTDNDCVITGTFEIRPDYWLDLCAASSALPSEYVNLKLNPERNTGYNGTVVWQAMHGAVSRMDSPEGIILQRLLSGYHASVSTQIMWSYYPPRKGESKWRPNIEKFVTQVFEKEKQGIRNMQFAFVVLARALFKIKDHLYENGYSTGNATADSGTKKIMEHLLDSSVLSVCDQVFSAFDESVMFARTDNREVVAPEFKKAFRKISRMVNCVSCHRCKLHARVAMHGIGVGIKILLTPNAALVTKALTRDDIVALVNTLHKFSESIHFSNEMISSYYAKNMEVDDSEPHHERALEFIAKHGSSLTRIERDTLVDGLVKTIPEIMLLSKFFSGWSFTRHALIHLGLGVPDMVVIGGGLAGLVTAISMADRGGSVVVVEKSATVGGNSAKASSGINSWVDERDIESFARDTLKSQNGRGDEELARILVERANVSVSWLEQVTGLDLSEVGQLGGHSVPRTHRPSSGVVGAELMAAITREAKKRFPLLKIITRAHVTELMVEDGQVEGVKYSTSEGVQTLYGKSIVVASGGFGFDAAGMVNMYRPDLVGFPTTLGGHTTGDGIRLAASLGAELVDMDQIQLHPTGFVDPSDRTARTKVLAAEILRGIGGIIVQNGERFVNELGTRKFVTDEMIKRSGSPFFLILSASAAETEPRLTSIYESRGLLQRIESMAELKNIVGEKIEESLKSYSTIDPFGRATQEGLPFDTAPYWLVGEITPVVHSTMGGVRVDRLGRVLKQDGTCIPNLFAVGEVSGGVHGENRLGGNSLLECTVFGRIIGGESVELNEELAGMIIPSNAREINNKPLPTFSLNEVATHAMESDCWTVVNGLVYDLSSYAEEHPGGLAAIRESCGIDSTKRFLSAHSPTLLQDMEFIPIGRV
jgi:flavocytochrome c